MKSVKGVLAEVAQLNEQGLRVLGVSYKPDLDEMTSLVLKMNETCPNRLPCLS